MIISIITVVYNDFNSFKKTEKSIVEQKKFGANIQWIVIDGGSSDGLLEFVSERRSDFINKIRDFFTTFVKFYTAIGCSLFV